MRRINPIFLILLAAFSLTASLVAFHQTGRGRAIQRTVTADSRHGSTPHRCRRHYWSGDVRRSQGANRISRSAGHHGRRDQEAHDARLAYFAWPR